MATLIDIVKKDSTDRSVTIRIVDSTTGAPETGVVHDTAGMALWYRREGGTVTALTESTLAAVDSAHSDGGMKHLSDGEYRVDLPDAAFATGANYVDVGGTVTGMIVIGGRVRLVDVNIEDAVRAGLTALPNAAADAAGGLPVSDAGGLDLDAKLANTNEVTAARMGALTDWINGGRLDLIIDAIAVDVAGLDGAAMRGTDNAALATDLATLLTRLSALRAGYLDNLNVGGNVASSAEVTAVQNNTRVVRVVPTVIERPDTGTATYRIELLLYDAVGNMEAPDSAPTIALVDQGGTDLSARLDSATMTLVSTGRYRAVYTASDTDDLEQLVWTFSVVEGGATRLYGNTTLIVDTTAVDFTSADRTKLEALNTDWTDGGRLDLLVDAILEDTGTTLPALMAASALRNALGLGSANLDTQLSTISTAAVLARKLKTGNIIDTATPGVYEILDDDDTTVIATLTLSETTPYQQVTLS